MKVNLDMTRKLLVLLVMVMALVGCRPQVSTSQPQTSQTATQAPTNKSVKLLRLDSNHAEFAWSQEIRRGVLQALSENGYTLDENLVLDERYLDSKRQTSPEYLERIATETIAYIRETKPDLVIVNDDTASRLVVQPMRTEGIPFVILGLNGKPEQYELDESDYVTGILERPHVKEMMDWIEQVFGDESRVSFLAEDSITTDGMFNDGSVEAAVKASEVEFVGLTRTNEFEAWQEFVRNAPETSDVLFLGAYASLRRPNGEAVEPLEALQWTLENSEIPVMGFWEEAVHIGTLGGPIISGYFQGYEAALRAVEVLKGTAPGDMPFSVPARGKLMVNRSGADHWKVEIPVNLLEVSEIVGS
jgi:ABC-type uncharacterized transport system substrate-binding protein